MADVMLGTFCVKSEDPMVRSLNLILGSQPMAWQNLGWIPTSRIAFG